jgi:hypothetical protein
MRADNRCGKRVVAALVGSGTLLAALLVSTARGDEGDSIDKVFEAWKQRQGRLHSARFEWTETRFYAKGSQGSMPAKLTGPPKTTTLAPAPSEDVTHKDTHSSLLLSGRLVRYMTDAPEWKRRDARFAPRTYTGAYNGKTNIRYYSELADGSATADDTSHRLGVMSSGERNNIIRALYLFPFRLHYRALDPEIGLLRAGEWRVADAGVLAGRECLVLRKKNETLGAVTCWVDPKSEYCILRYETYYPNGKVDLRVDIRYQADASHGSVPSHWVAYRFGTQGQLHESCTGQLTKHEFNPQLSDEAFELPFPEGTEVTDEMTKTSFIVRKNRVKRLVLNEERVRGATYEQLATTETGMAALPPRSKWYLVLWINLAIVAVGSLCLIIRRRWKKAA